MRYGKRSVWLFNLYGMLKSMREGQTIALAGVKEVKIFKLVEIREYGKMGTTPSDIIYGECPKFEPEV